MKTAKTPHAPLSQNPHFAHIDHAPYELGLLLQALPPNFSAYFPATPDARLIAEAAAQHAGNANDTIMAGLEALGCMLFSAGLNEDSPVEGGQLASIGCLIRHLAVEAQFLQLTEGNLRDALRAQEGGAT